MSRASIPDSLAWFILGFVCFHVAIHRPLGCARIILGIFGMLSMAICLNSRVDLLPYSEIWVPFVIGIILHISSILFLEQRVINSTPWYSTRSLYTVFRSSINFRNLPLMDENMQITHTQQRVYRTNFALKRSLHLLRVVAVHLFASSISSYILQELHVQPIDFGPTKQSLMPILTKRDLSIRAIISFYWIWNSYTILESIHNLAAIGFVTVLSWDDPSEWPFLFGDIAEAYSLQRFWGVFWQRLHVGVFTRYMSIISRDHYWVQRHFNQYHVLAIWSTLRAFWMFLASAICHAAADWTITRRLDIAREVRFFLSNFALCFMERLVGLAFWGGSTKERCRWACFVGYLWVMAAFFVLVPPWYFPLMYHHLAQKT
jgi:hypothetical protein